MRFYVKVRNNTFFLSQGREAEQPGVHGGLEEFWGALEGQESPGLNFLHQAERERLVGPAHCSGER